MEQKIRRLTAMVIMLLLTASYILTVPAFAVPSTKSIDVESYLFRNKAVNRVNAGKRSKMALVRSALKMPAGQLTVQNAEMKDIRLIWKSGG